MALEYLHEEEFLDYVLAHPSSINLRQVQLKVKYEITVLNRNPSALTSYFSKIGIQPGRTPDESVRSFTNLVQSRLSPRLPSRRPASPDRPRTKSSRSIRPEPTPLAPFTISVDLPPLTEKNIEDLSKRISWIVGNDDIQSVHVAKGARQGLTYPGTDPNVYTWLSSDIRLPAPIVIYLPDYTSHRPAEVELPDAKTMLDILGGINEFYKEEANRINRQISDLSGTNDLFAGLSRFRDGYRVIFESRY